MKRSKILGFVASAFIIMLTGCTTSDGFAFLGSVASAVGDDSTANAMNSIAKATEEITPENEYYIGRSVAANILTNYKTYSSPRMETYLNKICQAIVLNSDNPDSYNGYHVKILDSAEVNAFSTSGGHILITTGLIECAKSEDGLAAVVAHEIGHIQLKHSLKAIKSSRFTSALKATASAVMATELDGMVGDVMGSMFKSGYSQTQEYDADEMALTLMAAAGYDPNAMLDILDQMQILESLPSAKKGGMFKTHPSAKKRIANVRLAMKSITLPEDTKSYRKDRYSGVAN